MTTSILIIYTGGTIGMIKNSRTGALESFSLESLLEHVPEIRHSDLRVEALSLGKPIDSSDMNPDHWRAIARTIENAYDAYDGFVVLHGTDTMAFTASALSFMIQGLTKPIVLTGSQLPIGEARTDGRGNLLTAIEIASAKLPDGRVRVPEVCVFFDEKLLRGNCSVKVDCDNFAAFDSPNAVPLATAGIEIRYADAHIIRPKGEKTGGKDGMMKSSTAHEPARPTFYYEMDTHMLIFSLFPGLRPEIVAGVLRNPDLKGIIFRTFGSGNAPNNKELIETLRRATDEGRVIVNVSQCLRGSVHQERYGAGLHLAQAGILSGFDITIEAALTKMMHLFGRGLTAAQVREAMQHSIAGEISVE